jgi:hypothetical protein
MPDRFDIIVTEPTKMSGGSTCGRLDRETWLWGKGIGLMQDNPPAQPVKQAVSNIQLL